MNFLCKDPVMKVLKVKLQGNAHGPITALPAVATDLEVLIALMKRLKKARMATGKINAEAL